MTFLEGFLFGVLGGVLGELFHLFKLRQQPTNLLPAWVKSPWYWILTVNIGASAPLIVGTLVAQVPAIAPGKVD